MWEAYNLHDLLHDMFAGLELYDTDPAQHRITAGYDLDDLLTDPDLSDLSVRRFNSTRDLVPDRSGGAFTRTCFLGWICTIPILHNIP